MEFDIFEKETFDGYAAEFYLDRLSDLAIIYVEGNVRHRLSTTAVKADAMGLMNRVCVLTRSELMGYYDFA